MCAAKAHIDRRTFLGLAGGAVFAGCVPLGASAGVPRLIRGMPAVSTMTGSTFGTAWRVVLPAGIRSDGLYAAVEKLLGDIDSQMSPWKAESAISRFNRAKAGTYAMPDELVRVTRTSLDMAEASGGVFDPSVGPLVARWGFGVVVGDDRPGWRGLSAVGDNVSKDRNGLTLDLCGIAKGYALDRMAGLLTDADQDGFLIELGGEFYARGRHPSGRAWQVGVEDPRPGSAGVAEVLRLKDKAVATSGDLVNGYAIGDRRYSHIIDPRTGEPVTGRLASVSVVADDAMTADGWATALFAAGATDGPSLARCQRISALFLIRDGAGLRRVTTGAFGNHLA